jgi:hypothetical protein
MQYLASQERGEWVEITGDTAVLVGKNVVSATIWATAAPGTCTTAYEHRDSQWIALRTVATTV